MAPKPKPTQAKPSPPPSGGASFSPSAVPLEDLFSALHRHAQSLEFDQAAKVADQDEDAVRCKVVALIKSDAIDKALAAIADAGRLPIDLRHGILRQPRDKRRVDRENKEEDKEEEKGGFMEKVKDFIQDIGEKIEGAIGFGKPTADVTGVHIPHINLEKAEIVVDVLITNPNPVPIPLVDIDYLIESDGRKLVSGLIPDAGTVHAHGSETVKIPVVLIYDDIKSTYKDIEPGSIIPYKIRVALIVDVPILGRLTLPLEKTGEIPVPYKPDVDVEKIKFEKFSFEETTANLHLKLDNKNDFDLGLNALDYEIWLTDVSIGSAELTQSTKLAKRGITSMQLPISFKPKDFGSALWDMIRGRGTGYTIKGNIDVDTPFGNTKLPMSKEGGTTRLKKGDDDDDDED
ncbi:Late embryogenesis abundant protein Lea14-A [Ananas comosus]|uniref:Late embryogenesis abundant protein Lea14-A n=1 Tax=Ananas comosus TaxID=4615 RepID=A0A199VIR6_ANACO|nr:Late embryogenesis abundant protein Lea14-A [Ananas comosus]